jgi:two-component system capsular synthesis response regulator RcsB
MRLNMFKKVLVAEDIDSISIGLVTALEKDNSIEVHHTKYCDDALLKIKKAQFDNTPFDLLITDLSFKEDYRHTNIKSGEELTQEVKKIQSDIKVIMYSIEDRPLKIKMLFDNYNIDGYVAKGRNSTTELLKAIQTISDEGCYVPKFISDSIKDDVLFEIEAYDIYLLKCLSKGLSQEEISTEFKNKGYSSSSVSSIEKRINKLKIYFNSKNTTHLVSTTKDMGLI